MTLSPDAALIIAVCGNGPCTEMKLVSALLIRDVPYDAAVIRAKNAIVEATQAGRIEMPMPGVYRVTANGRDLTHDSENAAPTKRGKG